MNDSRQKIWPKVAVIIVNWNGERFLNRCLAALHEQTVMPHEIIVLDNASSDSSLEVAQRFPTVRLLRQSENLGFAAGNNVAINAAAGDSEWIALLNPDAFVEPCWLEKLLSAALDNPAFSVFCSKMLFAADPEVLDGAGDVYHVSGLVWRMRRGSAAGGASEQVKEVFSPCAAAAMYLRSALLEVGGFDEDYFCYVEDVDLGFRLRLAGHRCLYVPSSLVHHVGSGLTGGRHSEFVVYHGHRNLVWTYVKNMPAALFWAFLPLHFTLNLVTLIVFTLRGQGPIVLRAKRDAVRGIHRMRKKRRRIQGKRTVSCHAILRVMKKGLW